MARAKNNKNEKSKDWKSLCEYVKKQILEYDDNMKFPTYLALKLQGLKKGQNIANNNIEQQAQYDDYTLLCAFKLCRNKIVNYLHSNASKIKDENHKINLITKIVEPEINDVYIRIQQNKQANSKLESSSIDNQFNKTAEYQSSNTVKPIGDKLKNLW